MKDRHVQVRGLLPERVVLSSALDPLLPLRALSTYSGLGVRTLRGYLHRRDRPLPYYQIGQKVLVRRSEFDAWMQQFRRVGLATEDVEPVVTEILAGLTAPRRAADTRAHSAR